jgi:hypothetical protein
MIGSNKLTKEISVNYKNIVSFVNNEDSVNSTLPNIITNGSLNILLKARKSNGQFVSEIYKRKGYTPLKQTICCGEEKYLKYGNNNLRGHFRWDTRSNKSLYVRHYGNNMIVSDNLTDWIQIGLTDNTQSDYKWNYTSWWDDKKKQQVLVFVNGQNENEVFRWDGDLDRVSGVNGNIVTLSNKWANVQTPGKIWIGCKEYAYEKIEKNKIYLTIADPTIKINCLVATGIEKSQLVNHKTFTGRTFKPSLVLTFKNHIFYADIDQNVLFISKNGSNENGGDWKDLGSNVITQVRDGYSFICDNLIVGMFNVKDGVLIGCKNNEWHYITGNEYNTNITANTAINPNGVEIYMRWNMQKLTSGDQQGLKDQWLGRINQANLTFISEEPTLNYVDWGSEILNSSQNSYDSGDSTDSSNYGKIGRGNIEILSQNVFNDFKYIQENNYWEYGTMLYYKGSLYISLPKMGRTYIYDSLIGIWQPPQTLPFGALTIGQDGKLYGYDYNDTRVYEVFKGYNDNGKSYKTHIVTYFDDMNYPYHKKSENQFFFMAKANEGTEWKIRTYYDFGENGTKSDYIITARPQHKWDIIEGAQSKPRTDEDIFQFDHYADNMDENKYWSLVTAFVDLENTGDNFYKRQIQITEQKKDTGWVIFSFGTNTVAINENNGSNKVFGEELSYSNEKSSFIDPTEC